RESKNDGILYGMEVLNADLRGTELIFLSACQTAVGNVLPGEGVANLQSAFRLAGAQAVVGTLWSVPDLPSEILTRDFFANLAKGSSKPEAVRAAQVGLLPRCRLAFGDSHPFYWAAFPLAGQE